MPINARIIISADSHYVPSGETQLPLHSFADPVWQYGSFSYTEVLRSIHGPPEQYGQDLIVSCAYGSSGLTSRELESANFGDQGQSDQCTRISPNCVQRNAGWEAGKIGR
jgi:hypothetical protein